jgi:hypothetical protein
MRDGASIALTPVMCRGFCYELDPLTRRKAREDSLEDVPEAAGQGVSANHRTARQVPLWGKSLLGRLPWRRLGDPWGLH